jgi:hypothetical protein
MKSDLLRKNKLSTKIKSKYINKNKQLKNVSGL